MYVLQHQRGVSPRQARTEFHLRACVKRPMRGHNPARPTVYAGQPIEIDQATGSTSAVRFATLPRRYSATTAVMPATSPAKTATSINRTPVWNGPSSHWPVMSPNPAPTASEMAN